MFPFSASYRRVIKLTHKNHTDKYQRHIKDIRVKIFREKIHQKNKHVTKRFEK